PPRRARLRARRRGPAAGPGGGRRLAANHGGLPPGQPRPGAAGSGRGISGRIPCCRAGHGRPPPWAVLGVIGGGSTRWGAVWSGAGRRSARAGGPHLAAPAGRSRSKGMNHITCDLCGKDLPTGGKVRYEVRIEVKAAYDPASLGAEDLKKDYRAEIAQVLRRLEGLSAV